MTDILGFLKDLHHFCRLSICRYRRRWLRRREEGSLKTFWRDVEMERRDFFDTAAAAAAVAPHGNLKETGQRLD